jgi:hypothetical protein
MSYEDIPPEVMQELMAQYAASQGDPSMMTGEEQNFYGAIPSYDLEGDPYSLTSQFNQLQDFNQLIADPVMQSLGGIGAWSQEAFQPEVQWEQVDSPEYRRWRNYLNTPESFEGLIAAEIQDGGTPYSAMQKIQARVAEDPTGPLAQELGMNFGVQDYDLGGYLKDEAGNTQIDWGKAAEAATSIDELRAQIPDIGPGGPVTAPDGTVVPGAGEIIEVDGQLLRRTEVPSPLQEKFNELGLPSPYDEYTPESFMGPEWAAGRDEWEAGDQSAVLEQAMRDSYQQLLDAQNAPARPAPRVTQEYEPPGGGGGEEGDVNAPDPTDSAQLTDSTGRVYVNSPTAETGVAPVPVDAPTAETSDLLRQALSQGPDQLGSFVEQHLDEFTPEEIDAIHDQTLTASSSGDIAWAEAMNDFLSVVPGEPNIPDEGGGGTSPTWLHDLFYGPEGRGFQDQMPTGGEELPQAGGGQMVQGFMGPQQLGAARGKTRAGTRKVIEHGDFDASQTPGATFFPTSGEPPDEPTPLEVLLGIAPEEELPPLDPNAPVMNALPAGPASPEAIANAAVEPYPPVPNVPGRGAGVGDPQSAYNQRLLQQWLAENEPNRGLSAPDYLQRMATRQTGPPASDAAEVAQWAADHPQTSRQYNPLGGYYPLGAPPEPEPPQHTGWPYDQIRQGNAANFPTDAGEQAAQVARTNEFMQAAMADTLARQQFEDQWIQSGRPISDMPGQTWNTPPGADYPEPRIEARDARRQQEALDLMNQFVSGERTQLPIRPQRQQGPWDETIYGEGVNEPPRSQVRRPARHPEGPLGGDAYERMLQQSQIARRDAMRAAVLPTGEQPRQRPGGAPQSESVSSTQADRDAMRNWLRTGEEQQQEEDWPEGVRQWMENARRTGWREDPERKVFGAAVRKSNKYRMQRGVERQKIYGSDWGSALRAVYEAQRQGASPLQQALAQRVQNIRTAGAQIGASPRVVGW